MTVAVAVLVAEADGVAVADGVEVAVAVGVLVGVGVLLGVNVAVGVGVSVRTRPMATNKPDGVGCWLCQTETPRNPNMRTIAKAITSTDIERLFTGSLTEA